MREVLGFLGKFFLIKKGFMTLLCDCIFKFMATSRDGWADLSSPGENERITIALGVEGMGMAGNFSAVVES